MPVRFTDRADGDLAVTGDRDVLEERRRRVVAAPWTWLTQVHGARVVTVHEPGEHAGTAADGAVTATPGCPLAIHTADCVPVVLSGPRAVGVAHAGWRGLLQGVVQRTVAALVELGARPAELVAEIGPCIRARCYEFSPADLDQVARAAAPAVRSTTAWGTAALDLPAGVRAALGQAGVEQVCDQGICTACSPRHWSYRARGDCARQAAVAWLPT